MVDWCIAELQYKSKQFNKSTGVITVFDGDVVKSDTAIPTSLKEALRASALELEKESADAPDWHPGLNETVLDLVHPSLYPVVYGQTRISRDKLVGMNDCITSCGAGEVLSVPPIEEAQITKVENWDGPDIGPYHDPYSRKFQWLPCEVALAGSNIKYVILVRGSVLENF